VIFNTPEYYTVTEIYIWPSDIYETEQAGLADTVSDLYSRRTNYPDWGFSWFLSALPYESQDGNLK
jgi:hypothetical protein